MSQLMNIDEKKDDTCQICVLTKLTMILAYENDRNLGKTKTGGKSDDL